MVYNSVYNHKLKFESTINARKICSLPIFFLRNSY